MNACSMLAGLASRYTATQMNTRGLFSPRPAEGGILATGVLPEKKKKNHKLD